MLKNARQGLANHISHSQANSVKKKKDDIVDKGILESTLGFKPKTTVKIGKFIDVNKTVNTDLTEYSVDYLDSAKTHAVLLSDICSCGHDKSYHLNIRRCLESDCECGRFLP